MLQHQYFNGKYWFLSDSTDIILRFLLICKEYQKCYHIKVVKNMRQKIIAHLLESINKETIVNLQTIKINYPIMGSLPDDNSQDIINYEYVETITHSFDAIKNTNLRWAKQFYFLAGNKYGYGYRNLRILTNVNAVKEIELYANNSAVVIDKTYPSILKNSAPFDILQHNVLPIIDANPYEIMLICREHTTISYDVVKIINQQHHYNILANGIQYSGKEFVPGNKVKCKLNFNNTIFTIKAYLPESAKNTRLVFYPHDPNISLLSFALPLTKNNDLYWKIDFGDKGLNFNKIWSCYLVCDKSETGNSGIAGKNPEENTAHFFATALRPIIINNNKIYPMWGR